MVFANCHASFCTPQNKRRLLTYGRLQKLLATLEEVGCLEDVFRILYFVCQKIAGRPVQPLEQTVSCAAACGCLASSPGFSLLPRNSLRMTFDPPERNAEGEPGPFSHVIDDA